MQNEATTKERLIIHGDGTVTDSETGLMWTVSTFGKNIYGTVHELDADEASGRLGVEMQNTNYGLIREGEVNGFTWTEATKLFGRGRKIYPKTLTKGLSSDTYKGYEFAKSCPVSVGNYNDWRLPTVEEIATLVHEKNPNRNYDTMVNTKVFGEPLDLWTATYAYNKNPEGRSSAWSLYNGWCITFESYCYEKKLVRLVRSGSAFNVSFGQKEESFLIKLKKLFD